MSAPHHHTPGCQGGRPPPSLELHVRRGGGRGPGQDEQLPQDRGDAPDQGSPGSSSQGTMPKNFFCKYLIKGLLPSKYSLVFRGNAFKDLFNKIFSILDLILQQPSQRAERSR